MRRKIVIKVHMTCDKCRKKALGIAASAHGVQSMGIEGDERDWLVLVGQGGDAINLTSCLRKKVDVAEIVTVEAVDAAKEETKPAVVDEGVPSVWVPPPSYPYAVYCCDDRQDSGCTIL